MVSSGFRLDEIMGMTIRQVDLYSKAIDKKSARDSKLDLMLGRISQASQKDYKEVLLMFEKILKS